MFHALPRLHQSEIDRLCLSALAIVITDDLVRAELLCELCLRVVYWATRTPFLSPVKCRILNKAEGQL